MALHVRSCFAHSVILSCVMRRRVSCIVHCASCDVLCLVALHVRSCFASFLMHTTTTNNDDSNCGGNDGNDGDE